MQKYGWLCCLLLLFAVPALAQDYPSVEVFGGYSYLRSSGLNFNGGSGSVAVNPTNWLGLVGDLGVYHNGKGASTTFVSYLFGPRVSARKGGKITPYAQLLFGGAHVSASLLGVSASNNAFATSFGGGVDATVAPRLAVRLIQVEYLVTSFSGSHNNARISAGVVFRWGGK